MAKIQNAMCSIILKYSRWPKYAVCLRGNPKLDTLKCQMQWLTCNNDDDDKDGDDCNNKSGNDHDSAGYDGDDPHFQRWCCKLRFLLLKTPRNCHFLGKKRVNCTTRAMNSQFPQLPLGKVSGGQLEDHHGKDWLSQKQKPALHVSLSVAAEGQGLPSCNWNVDKFFVKEFQTCPAAARSRWSSPKSNSFHIFTLLPEHL